MSEKEDTSEQTGNKNPCTVSTGDIVRGVIRLLIAEGFSPIPEFTLSNGRRLDIAALGANGNLLGVEVKISRNDFRADTKWPDYLAHCDYFYFAVPLNFPCAVLPAYAGLIVADRYGGAITRPAKRIGIHSSRRRAVILNFARTAAERLARKQDPQLY